jgi:hypothetical protein
VVNSDISETFFLLVVFTDQEVWHGFGVFYFAGRHMNSVSRDSSVGITLGYGLDDRGFRVRFPAGVGNFSLHHRVKNDSGSHPASCPVGTRGSFPGGKVAGA